MIDYKFIKHLVENAGEVNDISDKSRKRYILDLRSSYVKLCFLYIVDFTQQRCGDEINLDHATIRNSLNNFKNYYDTNHFKATEVYDFCKLKLKEIYSIMLEKKIKTDIENIDLIIYTYNDIRNKIINDTEVKFETIK